MSRKNLSISFCYNNNRSNEWKIYHNVPDLIGKLISLMKFIFQKTIIVYRMLPLQKLLFFYLTIASS